MLRHCIVLLVFLLVACDYGGTASPTPSPIPVEQSEKETIILIVDEFGLQFDSMSEQVLANAGDVMAEYIRQFTNPDLIYNLPKGYDTGNLTEASTTSELRLTALLETYLADERLTSITERILAENIFPMEGSEPRAEAAGDRANQNCAVNTEGQGIFVTDGTGIFVTDGTSATSPGSTTFQSSGQGIFVTDGTGIFVTDGTGIFVTDGTTGTVTVTNLAERSHGERVHEQIEGLIATYGADLPIRIVDVPVQGYLNSNVAQAIQAAIEANGSENNYVINMSFAVIPCENMDSLLLYDALLRGIVGTGDAADEQIKNNLNALLALADSLTQSSVYRTTPHPDDAFFAYVDELCKEEAPCQNENGRVVFVGASGNGAVFADGSGGYAASFPYYPAAADSVISISASEESADFEVTEARAVWSNPGLHLLPGIWNTGVMFTATLADGTTVDVEMIEVGTSFAAPRYSVLAALQLAGSTSVICNVNMQADFAIPNQDPWLPTAPASFDIVVCR